MPHPSHHQLERSRLWLKVTGITLALGLHVGAFAFLMHSSQPKIVGEPSPEEVIGISLVDINDLEEHIEVTEQAEEITEQTVIENTEPEDAEPDNPLPEAEPEITPETVPEPEPIVEEPELPEPIIEKPIVQPKPEPKVKPKTEAKPASAPKPELKVTETAKPATAPVITAKKQATGGQQAKAVDPNKPRVIGQVNYLGAAPRPVYPRASQRRQEQGKVIVRVVISTEGLPTEAWVKSSSGHERLDEAALNAVRKVKFKPYTENGIAYRAMADIPFDFVL